jgi:hypothetical protein
MRPPRLSRSFLLNGLLLVSGIALLKFMAHLLTSDGYGYLRDELYFIAASKRLALGYVDFPLFIAWLTALVRAVLGESLLALRFLPALAGATIVLLAGLMARELGGRRFAQVVAAFATLVAPVFLAMHARLTMDAFDQLWWALCMLILLRLLKYDRPKRWLSFGLVAGLGLLTKLTMLYLGLALVVGLLLTPARTYLRSKWLWLGGAVAGVFIVPYLIWEAGTGWLTIEFWAAYAAGKAYPVTLLEFLFQQVMIVHPLTFPLAIVGVIAFHRSPALRPYRVLGWIYPVLFAIFALQQAKSYFLAAAYPVYFAAGAVTLECYAQAARRTWLKPVYLTLLVIAGVQSASIALPVLSIEAFRTYASALGGDPGLQTERHKNGEVPQYYADQFGWPELTDTVVRVYRDLPPEDQARACVCARNYGEAGALEFFGGERLPRIISGHNTYYVWGPQGCDGSVIIFVSGDRVMAEELFTEVEEVAVTQCHYCMPFENGQPILVARHPKAAIEDIWPKVKHFD